MSLISEWISNIILFILLATIIELLLPKTSMQRYVKMVVGLLLLLLLLQPLLAILKKDMNEWLSVIPTEQYTDEENLENLIENKKIEIESNQRAYISEQVAVQMKRQVEDDLLENFSLQLMDVEVSLNEQLATLSNESEIIDHVSVVVKEQDEDFADEKIEIEPVAVVTIDTKDRINERTSVATNYSDVQDYLAEVWQIRTENISLVWEGGEDER